MAQETNAIETRNSSGGFLGNIISGLGSLVKTAAPVAADVYSLKHQGELLRNQSANELAKLKAEQARLEAEAQGLRNQATGMPGSSMPAWLSSPAALIAGGVAVLLLVGLLFRRSRD